MLLIIREKQVADLIDVVFVRQDVLGVERDLGRFANVSISVA